MKKLALVSALFVTVHLLGSCTPRPEETADDLRADSTLRELAADTTKFVAVAKPHADASREHYILPVDTSTIARDGAAVRLKVTGPLGDGCQKYEYMDSVARGNTLYLVFWASRPKDPNVVCTQQMQYFQKEVRVDSSQYSRFSVIMPDGNESFFLISQ